MKLKEATEIIEKDKACAAVVLECLKECVPCSRCKYHTDPDKLDEARWTALRVMQAWKSAKEEIKKTCGCSTAYDIMEKYEKAAEGVEG